MRILYALQRALHVPKRRDAAYPTPRPPTEDEYNSGSKYAEFRIRQLLWHSEYIAQIWRPEMEHHSRLVVMNRNTHEHCKSCTKTERGKVQCRYCASWPSGIDRTRCVELRMTADGSPAKDGYQLLNPITSANGALDPNNARLNADEREAAVAKECRLRDLHYGAYDPSRPGHKDERALSVEICRPHMPIEKSDRGDDDVALQQASHTSGASSRLEQAVRIIEARERNMDCEQSDGSASDMSESTDSEPDLMAVDPHIDKLELLVKEATKARCPWRHLDRLKGLTDTNKHTEARSTLRGLVAEGQKLHRLLSKPEFEALREHIQGLVAKPSSPPGDVDEATRIAHELKEATRAEQTFKALDELTWSDQMGPMACMNGRLGDFTTIFSGCTKGNTAPYSLGAGTGSRAAAMYNVRA